MFSSTHNRKDVFCFVFSPTGLRRSKLRPYTSRPPLPRLFALQQKATASATTKHCSAWPGCAGVLQDQRESTADHGCDICEQVVPYKKGQQRRQTEIGANRHDQFVMRDNGMLTDRIQQAFMKSRTGQPVQPAARLFKVCNTNGNGSS